MRSRWETTDITLLKNNFVTNARSGEKAGDYPSRRKYRPKSAGKDSYDGCSGSEWHHRLIGGLHCAISKQVVRPLASHGWRGGKRHDQQQGCISSNGNGYAQWCFIGLVVRNHCHIFTSNAKPRQTTRHCSILNKRHMLHVDFKLAAKICNLPLGGNMSVRRFGGEADQSLFSALFRYPTSFGGVALSRCHWQTV
jgi:hypothetical protein